MAWNRYSVSSAEARDIPVFHLKTTMSYSVCTRVFLVLLSFGLLYGPVCLMLVHTWYGTSGRDDFGHGFFIVFVALYLVWRRRAKLARLDVIPHFATGVPVAVLAAVLLLVGKLTATATLEEVSLPVMLAGLILLLVGKACFRLLALPLFFLVFAIPIFDEALGLIHWPFQLVAAHTATPLLRLAGIPVYREAQYLQLPRITMEVAEACSGVRYLFSVLILAITLGYPALPTWRRRITLVAFAAAVAIVANGLRVALIGIWAERVGTGALHGPYHVLQGLFVSWIGLAAVFAGVWFLRGRSDTIDGPTVPAAGQVTDSSGGHVWRGEA